MAVGIHMLTQLHFHQGKMNKPQKKKKKKLMEIAKHDTVIHASQFCSIFFAVDWFPW